MDGDLNARPEWTLTLDSIIILKVLGYLLHTFICSTTSLTKQTTDILSMVLILICFFFFVFIDWLTLVLD